MFKRLKNEKGMSLIEIMIVLDIIAAAAAAITTQVMKGSDNARGKQTKASMEDIKAKVKLYKIDNGKYPQSLDEVFGDDVPKDGWNQDFHYELGGAQSGKKFDLWSEGADEDTEDDNISAWEKPKEQE